MPKDREQVKSGVIQGDPMYVKSAVHSLSGILYYIDPFKLEINDMATSRIDMRIDEALKASAEKAAALKGMKSLTDYVVRLIERDAEQVIKEYESVTLKNDVFDRFIAACEAAEAPNQKLRDARDFAARQGIQ